MSIRYRDKEKAYARAAVAGRYLEAMHRFKNEGFMGRPLVDFDPGGQPILNAVLRVSSMEADRRVLVSVSPFAADLQPFCRIASGPFGPENFYYNGGVRYYDDCHSPENGFTVFALADTVSEDDRLALFATMLLVFREADRETFGAAHPARIGSILLASVHDGKDLFGPLPPIETAGDGENVERDIKSISRLMGSQWGYANGRILSTNVAPFISLAYPHEAEMPISLRYCVDPDYASDVIATFSVDRLPDAEALGRLLSEMSGHSARFGSELTVQASSVPPRSHALDIAYLADHLTDGWQEPATPEGKALMSAAAPISGLFGNATMGGHLGETDGPWSGEPRWLEKWGVAREAIGDVSRSRLASCQSAEARRLLHLKVVADFLTYGKDTFIRD